MNRISVYDPMALTIGTQFSEIICIWTVSIIIIFNATRHFRSWLCYHLQVKQEEASNLVKALVVNVCVLDFWCSQSEFIALYMVFNMLVVQFLFLSLLTYLLTPWSRVLLEKLTGFAANQEIPCILWNPKVHYRTHMRPPSVLS